MIFIGLLVIVLLPATLVAAGDCRDKTHYTRCIRWRTFHMCNTHQARTQCPKTCGVCFNDDTQEDSAGECKDKSSETSCQQWKNYGQCGSAVASMTYWCPKTCGLCSNDLPQEDTGAQCQDRSSLRDCQSWKNGRQCQTAAASMKYWCAKTCGFCTSGGSTGQCGRTTVQQSRVVNGVDAKPGAWPWLASLQSWNSHYCGATLITPKWVLTASHCVSSATNLRQWTIKLGAHNHANTESTVQRIGIKRIIMHPWYRKSTLRADFALIELVQPARLNSRVTTACLPQKNVAPRIGTHCYVAGWGSIQHPGPVTSLLQQARLPIVSNPKCKHQQEIVCAGFGTTYHANACRGDSGGPLMCQKSDGSWQLDGVASYVVEYCKYYTGFAPVNKYLDWINGYIRT